MIKQRIIDCMDIDTRKAYGLPPRKLKPSRVRTMSNLLHSHDGLIYDTKTQTLFNFFNYPKYWSIHRPIELTAMVPEQPDRSDWCISLFNLENKSFTSEIFYEGGGYQFIPDKNDPWTTELKVLLK